MAEETGLNSLWRKPRRQVSHDLAHMINCLNFMVSNRLYPADTLRQNNVISTSRRRIDVDMTLFYHCVPAGCVFISQEKVNHKNAILLKMMSQHHSVN